MVVQDLRNGARLLRTTRSISALALLALALGIGASVAIFSVVDTVLLKPLSFPGADRLLAIYEKNPAQHRFNLSVAGANFYQWQRQSRAVEAMAAIADTRMNLTAGPNGHLAAEELKAERVSAGLFPLLGVQPIVGRVFLPEEDQIGRANFALLGYSLWQRRFGGDPAIAGKTIRLVAGWQQAAAVPSQSYTVVGVLPAGFSVLTPDVDIFVPLGLAATDRRRMLTVIGRLKPGTGIAQARVEFETIGDGLERADPALDRGWRPSLFLLKTELVGDVRQPLLVLLAAVGLLLVIACANVANLLLARGAGRRREIAIRLALGAGRGRIARQLITESLVLAAAGGVLGVGLARAAVALVARLAGSVIPRLGEAGLDLRILLFALAVTLLAGILSGAAPAIQTSDFHVYEGLAEGGRGGTMGQAGRALRNTLVVVEIGVALVVLIGAGLLLRSFVRLRAAHCGFDPHGVLTFRVPLAGGRNFSRERAAAFFDRLTDEIAGLAGVRSVGAVSSLPLAGLGTGSTFAADGRPLPPVGERPMGLARYVTRGYFSTMRIPLLDGRVFTAAETLQSQLDCVVNQTLARRLWPGSNPLGGRLAVLDFNPPKVCEIVGVVGDIKPDRIQNDDWPTFYMSHRQVPSPVMVMVVRTAGPPMAVAPAIQRAVRRLDPDQPIADLRTMDDVVDRAVSGSRIDTMLLTVFGLISFALAAVGIYAVVSYDVGARIHEIGIRMALGAEHRHVLRLVLGQVARLAALGIALGLVAAFALTRLMTSMLYGVHPRDFFTYAAISLILGAVALVAGYLPSRRALALDPVAALRHE